jgi:hypothetical protein
MPRIVRNRLAYFALLMVDAEVQKIHWNEATAGSNTTIVDRQVEAHYHALCTGDVELAKSTALYYGSELSEIARRLSIEAADIEDDSEKRSRFKAAADLFHHVVAHFDETDAYAWEYYAYNLARAGLPETNRVLDAYQRAFTLRRGNPLYHGRLLGFRAQLGQRIVDEAISSMRRYALDAPQRESMSFFAEPVMSGLWRGAQRQQTRELLAACGALLETLAPRAMQKATWAK